MVPSCSPDPPVSKDVPVTLQVAPTIKSEPTNPEVERFASYGEWHRVNDKPMPMSDVVSVLCRIVTEEEAEIFRSAHPDPHAMKQGRETFTVFVNDKGKDRLLGKSKGQFPVGTILVKEKHKGDLSWTSELLTVMVKREKGFAPKVGDWEFLVLDGFAKAVQKGDSKTCVSCHTTVSGNDFVYADYVPKQ